MIWASLADWTRGVHFCIGMSASRLNVFFAPLTLFVQLAFIGLESMLIVVSLYGDGKHLVSNIKRVSSF